MSRAVIQNGTHLWSDFNPHAAPAPLGFNMDFARAILNFGTRGSFMDNTRSSKEPEADQAAILEEDFLIDDLSEFSNEDIAAPICNTDSNLPKFQSSQSSTTLCDTISGNASVRESSLLETIPVVDEQNLNDVKDLVGPPCNDIAELEWLSAFDEDSYAFNGDSNFEENALLTSDDPVFFCGSGINQAAPEVNRSSFYSSESFASTCEEDSVDVKGFPLEIPVPGRARSKRSRSGIRVWSSGIFSNSSTMDSLEDSASDISNRPMGSQGFCSSEFSQDTPAGKEEEDISDIETSLLMQRADCSSDTKSSCKSRKGQDNAQPRRCAHCLSQKTPQWRAGPTGPKTLCNACGVRFKSGRLFPEYRPAKSPTFISHRHSNSHKRVLEMRRHKPVDSYQKQGQELKVRIKLHGLDQTNSAQREDL